MDELAQVLGGGLGGAVDVARHGRDVLGDPGGRRAGRRRERAAERARGAGEDEARGAGRDRLLEQVERAGEVGVDELLARVRADVRLVQRRGVEHGVGAPHRLAHDGAVGDRARRRSVCGEASTSSPTTSWPSAPSTRTSASPRWPALPVTSNLMRLEATAPWRCGPRSPPTPASPARGCRAARRRGCAGVPSTPSRAAGSGLRVAVARDLAAVDLSASTSPPSVSGTHCPSAARGRPFGVASVPRASTFGAASSGHAADQRLAPVDAELVPVLRRLVLRPELAAVDHAQGRALVHLDRRRRRRAPWGSARLSSSSEPAEAGRCRWGCRATGSGRPANDILSFTRNQPPRLSRSESR